MLVGWPAFAPSIMALGYCLATIGYVRHSGWRRWLDFSSALLFLAVTIFSISRTAWIMALVGTGILFLPMLNLKGWRSAAKRASFLRLITPLLVLILLAVLAILAFPRLGQEVLKRLLFSPQYDLANYGAINPRLLLWQAALGHAAQAPIFGTGGLGPLYVLGTGFGTLHNEWIDALFRFGIPGLVLFSALQIQILVTAVRVLRAEFAGGLDRLNWARYSTALFLIVFLLFGLTQLLSRHSTIAPLYYFLAGYLDVVRPANNRSSYQQTIPA